MIVHCDNTKNPASLCYECQTFFGKDKSLLVWRKIIELAKKYHPLDKYDQESVKNVKNILFGDIDIDDIDYVLEKGNKINVTTNKLVNLIPKDKEKDNVIKEENENSEDNDNMEKEEENIDENEESDDSYDESSEEEENEDDDNVKKKKKNLNDSFENECTMF